MALMACEVPRVAGVSLSRSPVVSARRVVPSAFWAPEVHASCSSISFSEGRSALTVAPRPCLQRRKNAFVVRGLFGLGVPELAVIAGVAALLFGPKQLPQLGKKLGQSVKSFQEAAKEFETEVRGDAKDAKANGEVTDEKENSKSETISPTPVATPSGAENVKSSS